jgi:hypothetical protein
MDEFGGFFDAAEEAPGLGEGFEDEDGNVGVAAEGGTRPDTRMTTVTSAVYYYSTSVCTVHYCIVVV